MKGDLCPWDGYKDRLSAPAGWWLWDGLHAHKKGRPARAAPQYFSPDRSPSLVGDGDGGCGSFT